MKATDYSASDPAPVKTILKRNDSASQTTLSTVDFLDTITRMLTTPTMESPSPMLSKVVENTPQVTFDARLYGEVRIPPEVVGQLKKRELSNQKKSERVDTSSKNEKPSFTQKSTITSTALSSSRKLPGHF